MINHFDLGYFGNIWVRQNVLPAAGDSLDGHKHHFDHVTLLVSGEVEVEVEGFPPKKFAAPTFIVIRKEHQHKVTALINGTVFYCVFALRDINGEVFDPVYGEQHDPLSAAAVITAPQALLTKLYEDTHDMTNQSSTGSK